MADRTSNVRVNVLMDSSGGIRGIGSFGKAVGVAALGVAGLTAGAALGANALYNYADAAGDANDRITNINKQMGLFGSSTAAVTQRILDQAKATSEATAVDINSIKATQAKLLTFKELAKTADETGGNFDRATQAAIDLASAGFGTAETNAVQLGKALQDPVKGLTSLGRAGVTFTDQEKARIQTLVESNKMGEAQALVLKAIESQVGGTAAATAGGFELMKNRVSIFANELALKAQPYMDRFGNFMIQKGAPAMLRFGQALQEKAVPFLRQVGTVVQTRVLPVLEDLWGFTVNHLVPAYEKVLAGALAGARSGFDAVRKAVGQNKPELEDMWAKAKKLATLFVDNVLPVLGDFYRKVLPGIGNQIGFTIATISQLWDAFNTVWDIAQKVASAIGSINDKLNSLHVPGGLQGLLGMVGARTSGGGGFGVPEIPFSHTAERGGFTVNFNGPVTDPRGTVRELEKLARRYGITNGAPVAA